MAPPQSGYLSAEIWIKLEFGNVGFWEEGKTGVAGGKPEKPGENRSSRGKTSRSREENQNKLNPHMASSPGIDPEPHRWQASALTTAPYLLPNANQNILLPNWSVSFRSHYIKNWAQQLPTHTITLKILDPATFHLPTQRAQFVSSSFKVYCFPVPFLKKKSRSQSIP